MNPIEASWLAELCGMLPRARRAVLLRLGAGGVEPHVEQWPQAGPPPADLLALANAAITGRMPRSEQRSPSPASPLGSLCVAVPLAGSPGAVAVEIADTGVGFAATTRGGVGLTNLRDRLRLVYGERASLAVTEASGGGAVVTLTIPA